MDKERKDSKSGKAFAVGAVATFFIGGTIGVAGYGGAIALVVATVSLALYAKFFRYVVWG
ncbi:MAG: hypothetical protein WC878_02210 [Candidatus Paceibacterota bacterium]|jgi:hypothetical protein